VNALAIKPVDDKTVTAALRELPAVRAYLAANAKEIAAERVRLVGDREKSWKRQMVGRSIATRSRLPAWPATPRWRPFGSSMVNSVPRSALAW